jgi:urea transport system permease protein
MLIQGVRTIFGAQNVQVSNPSFMSGGIEIFTGIVLPWNRIVIIAFAFAVLGAMWLVIARTRLGFRARRHAEPRDGVAASACRPRAWTRCAFGSARASRARRLRALADRQRRPDLGQATSSTRSWSSCSAASGSSRAPCTRR